MDRMQAAVFAVSSDHHGHREAPLLHLLAMPSQCLLCGGSPSAGKFCQRRSRIRFVQRSGLCAHAYL